METGINKVEVFSYDNGESFGYEIYSNRFYITKLNKIIYLEIESRNSAKIFINENYTLKASINANSCRCFNDVFGFEKYVNKQKTILEILNLIKNIDKFFNDNASKHVFHVYSLENEKNLDLIEEFGSIEKFELKEDNDKKFNNYIIPKLNDAINNIYK